MSAYDDVRVHATEHAKLRWLERVDGAEPNPTEAIERAFGAGIDVDIDGVDGQARLHPPTQTLLVHEPHWGDSDTRGVKTILFAREADLERRCERCACGAFHAPGTTCQCGGEADA